MIKITETRKAIIELIEPYMCKNPIYTSLLVIEIYNNKFSYGSDNFISFIDNLEKQDKYQIIGDMEDSGKEYYSSKTYCDMMHPNLIDKNGHIRSFYSKYRDDDKLDLFILDKYEALIEENNDYLLSAKKLFENEDELFDEIIKLNLSSNEDKEQILNYYKDITRPYCKIIGHYDITAVMKYIGKSNGIINGKYSLHFDDENNFINEKSTSKVFKIPSKPLYLYTEEDDKLLLELLQKLGKTN